jgi:hypothetical protein
MIPFVTPDTRYLFGATALHDKKLFYILMTGSNFLHLSKWKCVSVGAPVVLFVVVVIAMYVVPVSVASVTLHSVASLVRQLEAL